MSIIIATMVIPHITYANLDVEQNNIDIPSSWAKIEIDKAKEMGLIPERIQGEYKNSITREEFSELAVNLYEALIEKEVVLQGANVFYDTENIKVAIANELGIVNGKGNGEFGPYDNVTREQMSVMIYRTLQGAKPKYNYSNPNQYIFDDNNMISSWAKEAVSYLYGVEVINGVGDNEFNPIGYTSREEAIVIVIRMLDKVIAAERATSGGLTISRGAISRQESAAIAKLKTLIAGEMGKPYKWGATGPNSYDCSGLVYAIFGKMGISLPRTSRSQATVGTYVAKKDLQYGDIVAFARDGKNVNHVGIYVGNGEFVHSPESGQVVKKTTLMSGYYANSYYTARRVLP